MTNTKWNRNNVTKSESCWKITTNGLVLDNNNIQIDWAHFLAQNSQKINTDPCKPLVMNINKASPVIVHVLVYRQGSGGCEPLSRAQGQSPIGGDHWQKLPFLREIFNKSHFLKRSLRTSLCKNQTNWEMKIFQPSFKFCQKCSF